MVHARTKSLFILPAAGASLVLAFLSLVLALQGGPDSTAWWGAMAACLPLPLTLLALVLRPRARTTENAPLAILIATAGALVATWQLLFEGVADWQPVTVAAAGLVLLLVYVFWYARFGRIESGKLSVGSKLPWFTLRNVEGDAISSADFDGAPAVFLFYRGNWCPVCMAQVEELAARHADFAALGIRVALISSQQETRSRALATRLDVPFDFLVDEGNRVAEELDIAVRNGVPAGLPGGYHPDTVMPTVVVTNARGTIVFSDQTDNYRVRPEPDVFLAILRRAGAIA